MFPKPIAEPTAAIIKPALLPHVSLFIRYPPVRIYSCHLIGYASTFFLYFFYLWRGMIYGRGAERLCGADERSNVICKSFRSAKGNTQCPRTRAVPDMSRGRNPCSGRS